MAGIGADIAEVINELGTEVTVLRDPTNFTEKIMYDMDGSTSRFFYREYMLNAEFTNSTKIISGDIIQFNGLSYMVAHSTPESFENETVELVSVLYKCNFPDTTFILSPVNVQDPVTFEITQNWSVKKTRPYGLIYRMAFYTELDKDTSDGRDLGARPEGFIPSNVGVSIGDRLQLSPTEFYMVQSIEKYEHPGLDVLKLVLDERPVYVP
jgi:hypothetical protein